MSGAVHEIEPELHGQSAGAAGADLKRAYAARLAGSADAELAETFFNSVVRRVFRTIGVEAGLEFVEREIEAAPTAGPAHRTYPADRGMAALIAAILTDLPLAGSLRDLDGAAAAVGERLDSVLRTLGDEHVAEAIEVLPALFYRNKAAYLVARVRAGGGVVPLLLALVHPEGGVNVDAALVSADQASVVFGFTRSYFHVEVDRAADTVEFLSSIMPNKRLDELYTAIGFHKHGKRELYLELLHHLAEPDVRFEFAPGKRGMVMSVFTLPSFNVVFKIIKDAFAPPKNTSRSAVMAKYRMVFLSDRVGRLADAQEFEHLEFPAASFSPELLAALERDAATSVRHSDDTVVIDHLYTERRVTPLDVYLQDADPRAAIEAVIDYGNAIKDLAAADIFPGDMLLKNFGVTRHGRVIFYDYDELIPLRECNFRVLPQPHDEFEEFAAEPWYHVGENDVFPEEFLPFLVPPGPLRDAFLAVHADLLGVEFWRTMQERQRAGEIVDFYPYPDACRLHLAGESPRRERS